MRSSSPLLFAAALLAVTSCRTVTAPDAPELAQAGARPALAVADREAPRITGLRLEVQGGYAVWTGALSSPDLALIMQLVVAPPTGVYYPAIGIGAETFDAPPLAWYDVSGQLGTPQSAPWQYAVTGKRFRFAVPLFGQTSGTWHLWAYDRSTDGLAEYTGALDALTAGR